MFLLKVTQYNCDIFGEGEEPPFVIFANLLKRKAIPFTNFYGYKLIKEAHKKMSEWKDYLQDS